MFGKIIKRTIQTLAALGLLVMFGFPLTSAWLDAHPDAQAALDHAADSVDAEAGTFTKTKQFVSGYSKSREALTEEKRERAEDKLIDEQRRKEEANRRFNSGEMSSDSYNPGY